MKICRAAAELFRAYGRTDEHNEANNRFSQFCESVLKTRQPSLAQHPVRPRVLRTVMT